MIEIKRKCFYAITEWIFTVDGIRQCRNAVALYQQSFCNIFSGISESARYCVNLSAVLQFISLAAFPSYRDGFPADSPIVGFNFINDHYRGFLIFAQNILKQFGSPLDQMRFLPGTDILIGDFGVYKRQSSISCPVGPSYIIEIYREACPK